MRLPLPTILLVIGFEEPHQVHRDLTIQLVQVTRHETQQLTEVAAYRLHCRLKPAK